MLLYIFVPSVTDVCCPGITALVSCLPVYLMSFDFSIDIEMRIPSNVENFIILCANTWCRYRNYQLHYHHKWVMVLSFGWYLDTSDWHVRTSISNFIKSSIIVCTRPMAVGSTFSSKLPIANGKNPINIRQILSIMNCDRLIICFM